MRRFIIAALFAALGIMGVLNAQAQESLLSKGQDIMTEKPDNYPSAIFAGGCFWCLESEFRGQDGVLYTIPGYIGGTVDNPSYQDVTTGETGHAEAVEVIYDPAKTSYQALVDFFLRKAHNPTQVNRQGVDVGTQYRSALFPANEDEKSIAEAVIKQVNADKIYDKPVATMIEPMARFWPAEEYHQQYYEKYRTENGKDHIRVIMKKAGKL